MPPFATSKISQLPVPRPHPWLETTTSRTWITWMKVLCVCAARNQVQTGRHCVDGRDSSARLFPSLIHSSKYGTCGFTGETGSAQACSKFLKGRHHPWLWSYILIVPKCGLKQLAKQNFVASIKILSTFSNFRFLITFIYFFRINKPFWINFFSDLTL